MNEAIGQFVQYAIQLGGFMELDRKYLENKLQDKLQVTGKIAKNKDNLASLSEVLDVLCQNVEDKINFRAELLDLITPPPSVVNAFFAQMYSKDPKQALQNFYNLAFYNETTKEDFNVTLDKLTKIKADDYHLSNEGKKPLQRRYIRLNLKNKSYGFCVSQKQLFKMHGVVVSEEKVDYILSQMVDDLLELQQVFANLQIVYCTTKQKKYRFFEVAQDNNLIINAPANWQITEQETKISQLEANGVYLKIQSAKLMNLKLVLNQLLYYYQKQDFDLLSYKENDDYIVLLRLDIKNNGSFFGYDLKQASTSRSLEKEVKQVLGKE